MIVRLPGEPLVWQPGPLLPLDHAPQIPEAAQAFCTSSMNGSLLGTRVPHELLMMFGRLVTSGFSPSRSVGASIHSPDSISAASEGQHPLAWIQVAPGATPIWLAPPSSPTIVPIVWVPWPSVSQGASPQVPEASKEL